MAAKLQVRGNRIWLDGKAYRIFQGEVTWKRGRDSRPLVDRFWEKVGTEGTCWEFHGKRDRQGYGQIKFEGKQRKATHALYFLLRGRWPKKGLCVCHKCDNPPCVRPSHLFLGTNTDNVRDRDEKRRQAKKLTERQIPLIRSYYRKFGRNGTIEPGTVTLKGIAKIVGVDLTTVRLIITGERWKHL